MQTIQLRVAFISITVAVGFCLLAPGDVGAIPFYEGNVEAKCVDHNNVTYNLVATVTAPGWSLAGLQYVFTPTPATITTVDFDARTRYFRVTPGTYTVTVGNPNLQGTYQVTATGCAPPRNGMTWVFEAKNPTTGTILVGCGNACDPRKGDRSCTESLPLLCIRKSGPGFPLPLPAHVNNSDQYSRWSGGVVATTMPIVPPAKLADANAVCIKAFGPEWRVAEFHDGWGWKFQAYGGVGDAAKRFWVHINDQPLGNCWQ